MTDYNEPVDEFAPAQPAQPAQPAPAQPAPAQPAPAQPAPAQPAPETEPAGKDEFITAYDSIIAQQNEQIAALIAQNESLTNQITKLVQNGAQIGQPSQDAQQVNPMQALNPPSLANGDDWSLEALGREIGKPRKH